MRSMPLEPMTDRVAVLVASSGRPEYVQALLQRLGEQTHLPHRVVLSVVTHSDAPSMTAPFPIDVITGPKSLTGQRNRALDLIGTDANYIAFFDDDYLPARDALAGIVSAFGAFPQAGGITGRLLADGINGKGLSVEEALALLQKHDTTEPSPPPQILKHVEGLYGCNMAIRVDAIGDIKFDERLPLYGWQEDIDFSSQIQGDKIVTDALVGVHCGAKQGRERKGAGLGYSQIANPVYLSRKGTMSRKLALSHMTRNVIANHVKILRPEPWVDRRGRAWGNRTALLDVIRGRVTPERILDF